MSKIEFVAIGGQDEKDKSCCALIINDEIYVLNCGVHYFPKQMLGIDKSYANFDFLFSNKHKIKGIFIGHASYENFGGLEFLMNELPNVPVFTNYLGKFIINSYFNFHVFKNNRNLKYFQINALKPLENYKIGSTCVVCFRATTSLWSSFGFIFKTIQGNIIFLDEFIVSTSYSLNFDDLTTEVNKITNSNTLLLITSVGKNYNHKGFASPNYSVTNFFENVLTDSKNRTIVCIEDSDLYKLVSLANICAKKTIPFFIYSKRVATIYEYILKNKIVGFNSPIMLNPSDVSKVERAVIVITSNKQNLIDKIHSIINDEDENFMLKPTDTFVYALSTVAGYEKIEATIFDNVYRYGLQKAIKLPKDILSFSQAQEDNKFIINLFKPKYIIPIKGLLMNLVDYKNSTRATFGRGKNVLVLKNGDVATFENKTLAKNMRHVRTSELYVNSKGSNDNNASSMFECKQMSTNGCILASVMLDTKNKKIKHYNYNPVGVLDINALTNKKILDEIIVNLNETLVNIMKSLDTVANSEHLTKTQQETFKKQIIKAFDKKFSKRPLVLLTVIYNDSIELCKQKLLSK